jgi:phosphoenolpyruvate synthase/pyruvate phosphate dikinase
VTAQTVCFIIHGPDLVRIARDRLLEDDHASIVMLSPGPTAIGPVVHGKRGTVAPKGSVVILPDLRPAWLPVIVDAVAVITEEGGATAHLANVARAQSLPILRWPGALKIWHREGDVVRVDAEDHEVSDVRDEID